MAACSMSQDPIICQQTLWLPFVSTAVIFKFYGLSLGNGLSLIRNAGNEALAVRRVCRSVEAVPGRAACENAFGVEYVFVPHEVL